MTIGVQSSMAAGPKSPNEARTLLCSLGAPQRLITHVALVGEAAEILLDQLSRLGVQLDPNFIRIAVLLHDVGKIEHPAELRQAGQLHELAGEKLLLANGVAPDIARCCRSHAQWATMKCSLEELIVALADTLWKGKRIAALEVAAVASICERAGFAHWDAFIMLDTLFETIAANGSNRLLRSQVP
jgi:HD superfamily phosphodiesterase